MRAYISIVLVIISIFFAFFFMSHVVFGQLYTERDISLIINPELPDPNTTARLELQSFSINLDTARIEWFVNEEKRTEGIGIKNIEVQIGDTGTITAIRVRIQSPEGTFEKRVAIAPTAVDIIWEAKNSYVPPFYKGKALPSTESTIRFHALPIYDTQNKVIFNSVFNWSHNGRPAQNASGFNKTYFDITNMALRDAEQVEVVTYTVQSPKTTSGRTLVQIIEPKIIAYTIEQNSQKPLSQGITAIITQGGDPKQVFFAPFFATINNLRQLNYEYTLNGQRLNRSLDKKYVFDLLTQPDQEGAGTFTVFVENIVTIYQDINQSFSLIVN